MVAIPVDMFFMDPSFHGTLQQQVQRMVSDGILAGRFEAGAKLPSSRALAKHLGVSRITVTLAFTELVSDDYLTAKGRSGYFVSQNAPQRGAFAALEQVGGASTVDWSEKIGTPFSGHALLDKPQNWHAYRFPFVYGQTDERIFDHSNWRLCAVQALGKKMFSDVTADAFERDDPELVKYIARHSLPRRGIVAGADEILITLGAQHALWLAAQVLVKQGRVAAIENPSYPGLRAILRMGPGQLQDVPVDDSGMRLEDIPERADVIFATPSHHSPTNVTMPLARRKALLEQASARDQIIVEDDYEFEISFLTSPVPALKSLDRDGRVIYVGSFSKALFPGLRLGYLVGAAPFIQEARALRTAMLRHPPGHLQRTVANFLSLGHYDAHVALMAQRYRQRRTIMTEAIAAHGLTIAAKDTAGGSSFWMQAPTGVDSDDLTARLKQRGVLIEPGTPFFSDPNAGKRHYRLAYSSIRKDRIEDGIAIIADEIERSG